MKMQKKKISGRLKKIFFRGGLEVGERGILAGGDSEIPSDGCFLDHSRSVFSCLGFFLLLSLTLAFSLSTGLLSSFSFLFSAVTGARCFYCR